MEDNSQKNIRQYLTWMIPIIAMSKIIRWTVLAHQLVGMSIGWGMVMVINLKVYKPFQSGGSVIDNACAFFEHINILGIKTFEGWEVFFTIVYNIILYFLIKSYYQRHPEAGKWENFFIYLNVGVINIFCFTMSKECYQFLFWILIAVAVILPKTLRQKQIGFLLAITITFLYARRYYALVLVYYLVTSIFSNLIIKRINLEEGKRKLYIALTMMAITIGLFHYLFMGYLADANEDTYTEMIAANSREGTKADSEITPWFKGNQLMFSLNFFVKIFRLLLPVELLRNPKPVYLLLILFQGFVTYFIINAFVKMNKAEQEEVDDEEEVVEEEQTSNFEIDTVEEDSDDEEEEDTEPEENTNVRNMALFIYLGFLICSAGFEPDFGSWLRHESVAFPILILLM